MNILYRTIFSASVIVMLSGCTTISPPPTAEQVSQRIEIRTGHAGCKECDKVRTYLSPVLAEWIERPRSPGKSGVMSGKARLVSTNSTSDNTQIYRLDVETANGGDFRPASTWFVDENRIHTGASPIRWAVEGEGRKGNCVLMSCMRFDSYQIEPEKIDRAIRSGAGITFFNGIIVSVQSKGNDGYKRTVNVGQEYVGVTVNIPADLIVGFIEGVRSVGGVLPAQDAMEKLVQERRLQH